MGLSMCDACRSGNLNHLCTWSECQCLAQDCIEDRQFMSEVTGTTDEEEDHA